MSAVVVETVTPAPPVSRWAVAVLPPAGAVCQFAEFLIEPSSDSPAARVAYWTANPSRIGVSMAIGMLAIPLLIGGFVALARLTAERSRILAWTAFGLLAASMAGLGMVHGVELAGYALAIGGDPAAGLKVLQLEEIGIPGVVGMAMFLGGALLGVLVLAAAMWRSPYLPRVVPVLVVAFVVTDMVIDQPIAGHAIGVLWAAVLAVAVLRGYVRAPRQAAQ
ncbi:DUF6796 family protein [Acrocarpospora catenulata]|uniref:DUF6796 family protein n=1 Tax=Acrocarpospora catenulata TaxID=2836182 RepID=UPI001BDB1B52|nr:DUF6796 family protein [Acrocarpospora catenulata]